MSQTKAHTRNRGHAGAIRRGLAVISSLAFGVVLALVPSAIGGGAKAAGTVQCGDAVTRSIVLSTDLLNCPGVGIVVGAPNITIDLGGHTIDGAVRVTRYNCDYIAEFDDYNCSEEPCGVANAEPCGPPHDYVEVVTSAAPGSAIENTGYAGVTVMNGTSTDYAEATYHAVDADRFTIRNLRADQDGGDGEGNGLTVELHHGDSGSVSGVGYFFGVDVDHSQFSSGGAGVSDGSDYNTFNNNNVVNLFDADHNTVSGTTGGVTLGGGSDDNVIQNSIISGGFKPLEIRDSDRNIIRYNTISGSIEPIWLKNSQENLIENNTISGAYAGAYAITLLQADHNTVRNNTITKAPLVNKYRDGGGVVLCGASSNLVSKNTISDQFVGIGIDNDIDCDEDLVSQGNTLSSNTIQTSLGAGEYPEQTGDGITVGARALSTTLLSNTVTKNAHDGIDARSPSTTITKNTANSNGALGIRAVPGVTDGGGNKAQRNGDRRQCTVIKCG